MMNLTKFIYKLTKDSDRAGHLTAAFSVGSLFLGVGIFHQNMFLIKAGIFTGCWEYFCTMDHDHKSRQIKGDFFERLHLIFWSPFKQSIPHRNRLSHSLLIGTPLRLGYVLFPWVIAAIALYPDQAVALFDMAIANPYLLLDWGANYDWILMAAVAADTTHLIKDGFWRRPWTILVGKGC